jgi:hypothetical protein
MHQSTLIVLMFLTLGQIFMLTCGVLVLWLAGEFAHAPMRRYGSHPTDEVGETTIAMSQETGERSIEHGDGLMTLADDHSIQPQATEDRVNQLEKDVEQARDRADSAERPLKLG